MKKILCWIGVGLLGAAGAIVGQLVTNKAIESDVTDYMKEHGYSDDLDDEDSED